MCGGASEAVRRQVMVIHCQAAAGQTGQAVQGAVVQPPEPLHQQAPLDGRGGSGHHRGEWRE